MKHQKAQSIEEIIKGYKPIRNGSRNYINTYRKSKLTYPANTKAR